MDAIFADVGDRHHDDRLNQALANQPLRGFIHTPFDPAEGSGGVENILAIVEIKNRIMPPGRAQITAWQIDQHVASVAENARLEGGMPVNVTR